jgi:cob(I)alamin adenosyltransferase
MARTIARRAERTLIELADTEQAIPNPELSRFLNRLSDVLWLLARWEELG